MRLLFSLLDAGVGGGQQIAGWLASAAAARGHAVGLLVPERGPTCDRFEAVGGRTHLVHLQHIRQPRDVGLASRTLRDYDILWSHTAIGGQLLGDLAARAARRPHVIYQHTYPQFASREPAATMQRMLCRCLLGRRPFIAVAPHVRQGLVTLGIREDRIVVIPNGVPLPSPAPPSGLAPCRIGLLGRFDPGKGMLDFVDAARRTKLAPEEAVFTIGGSSGPFSAYEAELRAVAAAAHVTIEDPGLDGTGFLARQDIVVIPSRYEGAPLVLLEAMALGKAVIASDILGVTGIAGSSGPVSLVPVGDIAALSHAISRLVREPGRAVHMGNASRDLIVQHFQVGPMIRAALDHVESVARREGPGDR